MGRLDLRDPWRDEDEHDGVQITQDHMDALDRCVWKFSAKVPSGVDVDALRGAALESLAKSARAWDGRGDFLQWAIQRAWFAMIDELRRLSPNSRGAMRAIRDGRRHIRNGHEVAPVHVRSLNEVVHDEGSELGDLISDGRDGFDDAVSNLDVARGMAGLSKRERFLLLARVNGYGQSELAELLAISPSRVCQLQVAAAKKLVAACEAA